MYYVYYMFTYIYNEHERDSWLIVEKSLYTSLKAVASGREKWNYGGRGGYTTVYNLTFGQSCNFARHKSDLSPNQTQVDLSFLKDATLRSCLRLRPLVESHIHSSLILYIARLPQVNDARTTPSPWCQRSHPFGSTRICDTGTSKRKHTLLTSLELNIPRNPLALPSSQIHMIYEFSK